MNIESINENNQESTLQEESNTSVEAFDIQSQINSLEKQILSRDFSKDDVYVELRDSAIITDISIVSGETKAKKVFKLFKELDKFYDFNKGSSSDSFIKTKRKKDVFSLPKKIKDDILIENNFTIQDISPDEKNIIVTLLNVEDKTYICELPNIDELKGIFDFYYKDPTYVYRIIRIGNKDWLQPSKQPIPLAISAALKFENGFYSNAVSKRDFLINEKELSSPNSF